MFLYIILMMYSCIVYSSSPSPINFELRSASGSSADSEVIAEAVSHLFSEDDIHIRNSIRMHASRLITDDTSSPIRNELRASGFSIDNEHDRDYARSIAIRASQMVMSDLRSKADRKWNKKQVAASSAVCSVISSAIVLAVTLINKE